MSDTDPTLWPPPPLRPPVDVLEVERVRLVHTLDRLTITNLAALRALRMGLAAAFLPLPLVAAMVIGVVLAVTHGKPSEYERLRPLFAHALHSAFLRNEFIGITLFLLLWSWFLYVKVMHRGVFVLDKQHNVFQRGGKNCCALSELQTVAVKPFTSQYGKRWLVQLMQQGGDLRPRWRQLLTYPVRPDMVLQFLFRKREDAQQVAAFVARFAGVEQQSPPE